VPAGGERSFTTVAFILALGKFTESPFRAMDEYDVFMDAVNRRIATQTLLEFALEENNLQFVLLTPQVRQVWWVSKGGPALNILPLSRGWQNAGLDVRVRGTGCVDVLDLSDAANHRTATQTLRQFASAWRTYR
jgi:hypothetical protein